MSNNKDKIMARMRQVAAKAQALDIEIEPMRKCLHGRPCRHLDAPGMVSPMCELRVDGIFNLRECPLGLWWKVKHD